VTDHFCGSDPGWAGPISNHDERNPQVSSSCLVNAQTSHPLTVFGPSGPTTVDVPGNVLLATGSQGGGGGGGSQDDQAKKPSPAPEWQDVVWATDSGGNHRVYLAKDGSGNPIYVDRTKNPSGRFYMHGYQGRPFDSFEVLNPNEPLTMRQAQAIGTYIAHNNPHFLNKPGNSYPAKSSPYYQPAMDWAKSWLQDRGMTGSYPPSSGGSGGSGGTGGTGFSGQP